MAYEVIARKWRPQTFDEVVGQEAITQTLRNAVAQERLHHAYLFTGARGVGKTTTARILAKSLNCRTGVTATPCGTCASCVEIAAGGSLDVMEIDAASHTGVDNIRDVVISSVGIAPARDRYKVFIVDEVHQLSAAAFNALLKTLEEPPSRVVFILATTELHKVPDTIASRCQLYEFRTIPLAKIHAKLAEIAANMNVQITPAALAAVARAGEGSMRDAQSALDQVIAFAGESVDVADVATSLGIVGDATLYETIDAIAAGDGASALRIGARLAESGHDLRNFTRQLMRAVRNLLFVRAVGYDADADTDLSFLEGDSHPALSVVLDTLGSFSWGVVFVSLVSITILLLWETSLIRKHRILSFTPGPLVAVLFGIAYNGVAKALFPPLSIGSQHLVNLPAIFGPMDFARQISFPAFTYLTDFHIYVTAATFALVGSLETLLSLEAVDKLDPLKRVAPTNQELKAQGVGNFLSGMIGGLPITAVIVRSSASIDAGAHTKVASIVHGVLLLLSVIFLSSLLNMIPLACLAAVLLLTGYKLAKPKLFVEQYARGFDQFAPFAVTVGAILATDLLDGMAIGMAVGLFFVLRANYHSAFTLTRHGSNCLLRLNKDVSFLNKAQLRSILEDIEENSYLVIDGSRATFIDHDIMETLEDFMRAATDANIRVELKDLHGHQPVKEVIGTLGDRSEWPAIR